MKNRIINLQLFADGGEGTGAAGAASGTAGNGANGGTTTTAGSTGGGASYSFEQAEQIANARAEHASRAALAKYFESQGMSQEEVTAAISDFKAKKAAAVPNVAAITKERDEALEKIATMEQSAALRDRGVSAEDLDYVLFKIKALVNDKTDFKAAADKFLKDNPKYAGTKPSSYRVSTGTGNKGEGGAKGNPNDAINEMIRNAVRR